MIKILHTEPFLPLGKAIPMPAPAAPKSIEIKPGIWQAPDGKLRTDFATGQSIAPAPKAAPATPLPVVPNVLGDGWIAWAGGECPIPDALGGKYEVRWTTGAERSYPNTCANEIAHCYWTHIFGAELPRIVAYRLIP